MYKLLSDPKLIQRADGAIIPADDRNQDYRDFIDWVTKGGNTPDPADPVVEPPIEVTPWQIRKALNTMGMRGTVENAVTSSNDITLKDGWQFATSFIETDPFVVALGQAIGKSPKELHDLFELAKGM